LETEKNAAQQYFELADAFVVAIRSDEVIIDINKKGCSILGYTKNEIIGKNWFENFLPKATVESMKRVFHDTLNGPLHHVHYEHPILTKQGKELTFNWHNLLTVNETGKILGTLSSGADVTEQRQIEKTMKETENRLQRTLDSMLEGCQIIDFDYRYAYINDAAAKQGRQTKQELLGHTMMEIYPGIEKTEMFSHLKKAMTNRIPHYMENEFTFQDGSKAWFDLRIEPVPEGVLILSIDVTRHKQMEKELDKYRQRLENVVAERTTEFAKKNRELIQEINEHRKTEEDLLLRAMILDNAGATIFLINKNGDFLYANEEASKTYGYTRDEFLSMNIRILLRPQDVDLIKSRLQEATEKGTKELETVHLRKDRTPMTVQIRHTRIETAHGEFIVTVIRPSI
jgi:PAS domain S-box-containing protein